MSATVQRSLCFPVTRSSRGNTISPTGKTLLDVGDERPSAARRSLFSNSGRPVAAEAAPARRRGRASQQEADCAQEYSLSLPPKGDASFLPHHDDVRGRCMKSSGKWETATPFPTASAATDAAVTTSSPTKRPLCAVLSPVRRRCGGDASTCEVLTPRHTLSTSTTASPQRRATAIATVTPSKCSNAVADRHNSVSEQSSDEEEEEEQCSPSKQRSLQARLPRDLCRTVGDGGSSSYYGGGGGVSSGFLPLSPTKLNLLAAPAAMKSAATSVEATAIISSPQKRCKENVPATTPSAVASRLAAAACSPPQHRGSPKAASLVEKLNSTTPRRSLAFDRTVTAELKSDGASNTELLRRAKRALHTAQPSSVCCREREASEIKSFVSEHVTTGKAGSMYISGPPGTGKTALLRQTLEQLELPCHKIFVNCMSVKSWPQLYELVSQGLAVPSKAAAAKACGRKSVGGASAPAATAAQLQKLLSVTSGDGGGRKGAVSQTAHQQLVVLVLDEIDQLIGRTQELLYTIFEWPTLNNSRLILIGIANALDFTDRLLPRLHARPNCRPKLLHFKPYTMDQIQEIIRNRLVESNASNALDAMAIQFCSRKIAAVSGDIRKALDVCRRSIEIAEVEKTSLTSPTTVKSLQPTPKPRAVSLQAMMGLLSDVPCQQSNDSADDGLPLQQKLAACSLLLLIKHSKLKEVTFGKLHDTYCRICRRRQDVAPTDQSEFLNVCALLEARGVLALKKAKDDCRMSKVSLKVNETELERVLQDKLLISSVLREGIV